MMSNGLQTWNRRACVANSKHFPDEGMRSPMKAGTRDEAGEVDRNWIMSDVISCYKVYL